MRPQQLECRDGRVVADLLEAASRMGRISSRLVQGAFALAPQQSTAADTGSNGGIRAAAAKLLAVAARRSAHLLNEDAGAV